MNNAFDENPNGIQHQKPAVSVFRWQTRKVNKIHTEQLHSKGGVSLDR